MATNDQSLALRRANDRWHGIVTALLVIALGLMWWVGYGPNQEGCCGPAPVRAPRASVPPRPESLTSPRSTADVPRPAVVPTPLDLGFSNVGGKLQLVGAVQDDVTRRSIVEQAGAAFGAGNVLDQMRVDAGATPPPWLEKAGNVFDWLKAREGNGVRISGGAIALQGTVASEADKNERGNWAQRFFGPDTRINNQLQVAGAKPGAAAPAGVPPIARVYFATESFALPEDADKTLARMIAFLRANANARVALAGFHDALGDRAYNEALAENRAKQVREALRRAGIGDNRIVMQKPANTTGTGELREARRVEVSVVP
jgi:outer membrane protein OmpA-like peptidoglycan-associated protein